MKKFDSDMFPQVKEVDEKIADKLLKEHPDWDAKQLADEYVRLTMCELTDIWGE